MPRLLKVFNSTRHPEPIAAAWKLTVGGKVVGEARKTFNIPPGEAEEWAVKVAVPTVARRTEGEFVLTCSRGGKEVFREVKAVSVPPETVSKFRLPAGKLFVIDPKGAAARRLERRGASFTAVKSLADVPAKAAMLLVGHDAISAEDATSTKWYALAAAGTKILVLEQEHPLHYQAVPADFDVTGHAGRIAFCEDLGHPVFRGLAQKDPFTWSGDHVVYKNAYTKASSRPVLGSIRAKAIVLPHGAAIGPAWMGRHHWPRPSRQTLNAGPSTVETRPLWTGM